MEYFLLALFQGVTEFVPVSSSGHLVFFQRIFGFEEPMLAFDIILHLATTLAVIVFLYKDLCVMLKEVFLALKSCIKGKALREVWREFTYLRICVFMAAALIPAIIIGVALKDIIENLFGSMRFVGIAFIITGCVLFITKRLSSNNREMKNMNIKDALIIGIAQAAAIMPGISRSGMTIASGIFRGLDKNVAARFSFMLSIPTILAASVYQLKDGLGELGVSMPVMTGSFLIAFISGYIALVVLSKMISKAKFHYFSYYCWTMGIITIILSIVKYN
ncbi:MAG: undecaprenyl-diphosphate phosphatase [PVC group bacterium]|nr:undecaprenyl-diphosphate phosphatase [PVC group bacterium]